MECRFIADVHLGKLARLLRLLGFDTLYKNDFTLTELMNISRNQERILLSRNLAIVKDVSLKFFIVRSEDPFEQLKQLIYHFNLNNQFHSFSRCLVCNGILETVAKEKVASALQQNTLRYFNEFWQCKDCKRIYWKGSHYERMLKTIKSLSS